MILRSLFPYRHPSQCRHSFLFCLLFLMRSAGPTLAENANITCNAFYIRVQPCSHCWLGSVHFLTRTKLHKVLGRQLCDRRHPVYGAACQRYSRNVRMWWTLVGIYRLSIFFSSKSLSTQITFNSFSNAGTKMPFLQCDMTAREGEREGKTASFACNARKTAGD